eukprot:GDKJ01027584.1.p1 GENE.GDKJ01027584.1~~GDKJ01027584.1.p1  ORF type:complete len:614 (-),score=149.62 GDKJ01027584.1:94-1935(-)
MGKVIMNRTEGLITIGPLDNNDVFYNPPQVFNRDLSMLIAKKYAEGKKNVHDQRMARIAEKGGSVTEFEGIDIIEPLAASGLRSFRYALELPKGLVRHVVANDLEIAAVAHIEKNRELNKVSPDLVSASQGDANSVLHLHRAQGRQYDIIDLDPYGTVSPFLDSAIYNIKNGGLLCLTSTDMTVLGGNTPEVCFYKYGGNPLKRGFTHELAVRLVLNAAVMTAAKYSRHIKPILSLSVDFYIRLFVIVQDKPYETKLTSYLTGQAFSCLNCESFQVVALGNPPRDSVLSRDGLAKPKEKENNEMLGKKKRCSSDQKGLSPCAKRCKKDEDVSEAASVEEKKIEEVFVETKTVCEAKTEEERSGYEKYCSFASEHGTSSGTVNNLDILKEESRCGNGRCRAGYLPSSISSSCRQCNEPLVIAGPFYRGSTYDRDFVQSILDDIKEDGSVENMGGITMGNRISAMLGACIEELNYVPLFYNLPALFKVVSCSQMPLRTFKGALLALGYKVSHFHRDPQGIKTNAPDEIVWDLVRLWAKRHPPKNIDHPILRNGQALTIPEDLDLEACTQLMLAEEKGRKAKFLPNPLPNWGPKARADGKVVRMKDSQESKIDEQK